MSDKKRLAILTKEQRDRIAPQFPEFHVALVTKDPRALIEWAESGGIDAAALCELGSGLSAQLELTDILQEFGIDIFILRPSLPNMVSEIGLVQKSINGKPLVALPAKPVNPKLSRGKRLFDVVLSTLVVALGMPLWLLIALAIVILDGKRVFSYQHRIGSGGVYFKFLRFRTTWRGPKPHRLLSMLGLDGGNPELTPVGKLIKRVRLDEFPQFWHSMRGTISVVGPRPPVASDTEWYQPWHRQRLAGWFGITGLCQICGLTGEEHLDEIVLLDMLYLRNHSVRLDWRIVRKTAGFIFSRRKVDKPAGKPAST